MNKTTLIVGGIALVAGIGLGGAAGSDEAATPASAPTVTSIVEREVEVQVEVAVVPESCLLAVDALEFVMDWVGRHLAMDGEAWDAASRMDTAELNGLLEVNAEMTAELTDSAGRFTGVIPGCRNA